MNDFGDEKRFAVKARSIIFAVVVLALAVAIITYNPADNSVLEGGVEARLQNSFGLVGATASRFCFYWFGLATYPILVLLVISCIRSIFPRKYASKNFILGMVLLLFSCSMLFALNPNFFCTQAVNLHLGQAELPADCLTGGVVGQWLSAPAESSAGVGVLTGFIGMIGSLIFAWLLGLAGLIMLIFADWRDVGEYVLDARRTTYSATTEEEEPFEEPAPAPVATPEEPVFEEPSVPVVKESLWSKIKAKLPKIKPQQAEEEEEFFEDETPEPAPIPVPAQPIETPIEPLPQVVVEPIQQVVQQPVQPIEQQTIQQPVQPIEQQTIQQPVQPIEQQTIQQPAVNSSVAMSGVKNSISTISFSSNASDSMVISVGEPTKKAVTIAPPPVAVAFTPPPQPLQPPPEPPQVKSFIESRIESDNEMATRSLQEVPEPDTSVIEHGENVKPKYDSLYELPPISLLGRGKEEGGEPLEIIERNKGILQDVLDSFKVNCQVSGHISGPRLTRYDITLSPGVGVAKITNLHNNIKMSLRVKSIRILAPIPGRDAVGVEIPNTTASAIFASEIMRSSAWRDNDYDIPVVLGKNVSGEPVIMDLAKAPHLLIAGTTGSGKSVCMNTLIISLLLHFQLDDLRLILVDPKVVEHAPYKNLPQLITPVINDAEKVPLALKWGVAEMEKRYRQLADTNVKTLKDYNRKMANIDNAVDSNGAPLPKKMPYFVIILDELADLMMTEAKGEIETSINRIAAKGRAAGIHIVVATQSPRKDVVTGLIKANLPTRISFAVSSGMDSRVVLDCNGAENLLGRGDMLFQQNGSELERVQGAIVPDEDITKIVDFITNQASQHFNTAVMTAPPTVDSKRSSKESNDEVDSMNFTRTTVNNASPMVQKYLQPGDDDLIARTLEFMLIDRKVSTSLIQRRLKIGYNRAAEIMDTLESRNWVGPDQQGGKARDVLIFDGLEDGNY